MTLQKKLRGIILAAALVFFVSLAYGANVTISTFYPSPYGSYQKLDTTDMTHLATGNAPTSNVLIGATTDPGLAKLQVGIDKLSTDVALTDVAAFTTKDNSLGLIVKLNGGAAANQSARLQALNGHLILQPDGSNVGIGLPNPNERLVVRGFEKIVAIPGDSNHLTFDNGANIGGKTWHVGTIDLNPTGNFNIHNQTDGVTAMTILPNGNVGLGTNAPGAPLEINSTNTEHLRLNGNAANGNAISANEGGVQTGYIRWIGNAADFNNLANGDMRFSTNGQLRMTILAGGDIIMTQKLTANSDARFKTDITPMTGILPKLDQLRGVSYEPSKLAASLGQSSKLREIGVVGQELEKVFPELVVKSGPEQYRSVDYSRLSVVLLEAVKELKAETETLKSDRTRLEARVKSLEAEKRG